MVLFEKDEEENFRATVPFTTSSATIPEQSLLGAICEFSEDL